MRTWTLGLLRHRLGRLTGLVAGIAIAVALLASLGSFLSAARAGMTRQAIRAVAVDWQVAVTGPLQPTLAAVRAEPGTRSALPVGLATVDSLSTDAANGGGTSHQTAQARVLGIDPAYASTFPGELRLLSGSLHLSGREALLAQQSASNLAARVGSVVTVHRPGAPATTVTVAGIVELTQADSLFQKVGAPAGAQASAPPDNVLLLDLTTWHNDVDPLSLSAAAAVAQQIHVGRDHNLPHDPAAAYTLAVAQAHHLEARLAGAGIVGNNLAATLDTARADALYAQVLFLFLGLPGAVLAAALTATAAAAGALRRRREQAMLRLRGATTAQVLRLAAVEALVVGVLGAALGLAAASLIGSVSFGRAGFGASTAASVTWALIAAGAGLTVALGAVLLPTRRDLRATTVAAARSTVGSEARDSRLPLVLRLGLDGWLLVGAYVIYRVTSAQGYSLVLAPEGVSAISVSYWAFAGPAMLWLGSAALTWRLVDLLLHRGRRALVWLLRPLSGNLAGIAVAGASRQRRLISRAAVLAGLALAFATSTAVFNSTYQAQAGVDARLTNGADIAVTHPPGTAVAPGLASSLARVRGVGSVEPVMHRYAYIGADLQDLYGVRASTVQHATSLQDSYFTGGSASQLMSRLARQPDAILVSSETVKDYQLTVGDPLTLRLQDTTTQGTIDVRFHYVGVAKEFPTAPHDSFFVTNADYVAQATGNATVGTYLLSSREAPHTIAGRVRALVGASAVVTDIQSTRTAVGSSLTAVDLTGLTRVELGFALLLALAGGGLILALGVAERRRDLAVITALGATPRQRTAIVGVDTAVVVVTALLSGAIIGGLLSQLLVTVLSGVFDPAPEHLVVPWPYLGLVAGLTVLGAVAGTGVVARGAGTRVTAQLRGL